MTKRINFGIAAHVDAGKTTVTEQLLYVCGNIRQAGSVDKGTAQTDYMDIERNRGISVRAASTEIQWNGVTMNLIDTPGHADFAAEAERALRVLDCVVIVLSAVEGVQARTEVLWQAAAELNMPVMFFINKIDRAGADIDAVLAQIHTYLTPKTVVLQGVAPDGDDGSGSRGEAAVISALDDAGLRDVLAAAAADQDDELMLSYLDGAEIADHDLKHAIRSGCVNRQLFPVVCGSALKGTGITGLLDAIVDYFPLAHGDETGEAAGVIFKVEHDKAMGRIAHVRLYAGILRSRGTVYNHSADRDEKINQIRKFHGKKYEDTGVLKAGDIAALCGLNASRAGDILGNPDAVPADCLRTAPLLRVRVYPEDEKDYPELVSAINELAAEDPLLDMVWASEERELLIRIAGLIQRELIAELLSSRYGLRVQFSAPSIIYKETVQKEAIGFISYTRPWPCWAVLKFVLEPGERGSGVVYSSTVSTDKIYQRYQTQVANTIADALAQGPLGWEVTDLKITLVDGEHHVEHTHPLDFIVATPMAIMDGLYQAGTTLLEPMLKFRVSVPEDLGGRVMSDMIAMRASFEQPHVQRGVLTLEGIVPAAAALDYPMRLASISAGRANFSTAFAGYHECPLEYGATAAYRGINPIDRSKYILHARAALQG